MKKNQLWMFVLLFAVFIIPAVTNAAPTPAFPTKEASPVWKGSIEFRWTGSDAGFTQYHINLLDGSAKEGITASSSHSIYDLEVGDYSWAVRSCNDRGGTDCGPWSPNETFNIVFAPAEVSGGLIACGSQYDNPDTPNNESEPCGIPHLFLLLNNLLNFALWKAGLFIVGIMAIVTAVTSFFSFGSLDVIPRIKAIWKSILIGYLVMLLAWLAVNVILNFFGFQFQWWAISF